MFCLFYLCLFPALQHLQVITRDRVQQQITKNLCSILFLMPGGKSVNGFTIFFLRAHFLSFLFLSFVFFSFANHPIKLFFFLPRSDKGNHTTLTTRGKYRVS